MYMVIASRYTRWRLITSLVAAVALADIHLSSEMESTSMIKKITKKMTYANVVATLALTLTLTGSAYAIMITGTSIVDGSIKSADLATGSVKASEIYTAAVTNTKLQNGSVSYGKLAGNVISEINGAYDVYASVFVGVDGDMVATVDSDRSFSILGGDVSVIRNGVGDYDVTVPGIDVSETPIYNIQATVEGATPLIAATSQTGDVVTVTLVDSTGAAADPAAGTGFSLAVL